MAQFEVYEVPSAGTLAVDVQSNLLSHFRTRLIVPLLDDEQGDWPMRRLAPRLEVNGRMLTLATPFMTGVPLAELKGPILSLAHQQYEIMGAIDFLLTGI